MVYNIADKYEIRPFSNGLCWELFEKRIVRDKRSDTEALKWISLGKYPSTLKGACTSLYDIMLRNGDGELADLPAMSAHIQSVGDSIIAAVTDR